MVWGWLGGEGVKGMKPIFTILLLENGFEWLAPQQLLQDFIKLYIRWKLNTIEFFKVQIA